MPPTSASPASHRPELDISEHQVLDREADEDHTEEPREDTRHFQLILVLVDEPPQPSLAGADAEDQLGGDQSAPSEGPADLQTGQDAGKAAGMRIRKM